MIKVSGRPGAGICDTLHDTGPVATLNQPSHELTQTLLAATILDLQY